MFMFCLIYFIFQFFLKKKCFLFVIMRLVFKKKSLAILILNNMFVAGIHYCV